MALAKKPLRAGVGDLLSHVSGEGSVTLAIGSVATIEVDHTVDARFAFAEMPRFEAIEGVLIRLLCEGTNGDKFTVELENISHAEDISYTWSRRGISI